MVPTATTLPSFLPSTFTAYAAGVVNGRATSIDLVELGKGETSYQAMQSIHANMKDHRFTELYGIDCEPEGSCDCYYNLRHIFRGLTTMEDVLGSFHPEWEECTLVTFLVLE